MKNRNLAFLGLGILFLTLSVLVFVLPTKKTETLLIVYVFTAIAFIAQITIWKNTFRKKDKLKSKFLGLSVVYISIIYLIIQIIVLVIFTAIPTLPIWSAIIICTVILGISTICMLTGEVGRNEIERVEEKVQKKVSFIKELQTNVELLMDTESNATVKIALQKLAEQIRFSDPMSNEALIEIEENITTKVTELKTTSNKLEVIQALNLLLTERNKKGKILK